MQYSLIFTFLLFIHFIFSQGSSPCNSIPLVVNTNGNLTITGSNVDGSVYTSSSCNSGLSNTIWYSITPTAGSTVFVSTCSPITDFSTSIGIYSGSCNNPVCSEYLI